MIEVSCKIGYYIWELRQLIYNMFFDIKEKGKLNEFFGQIDFCWIFVQLNEVEELRK